MWFCLPAMFQEVAEVVPDITVLRRLLFASAYIPKETPLYWEEVTGFAFAGVNSPGPKKVQVLMDNIELLDQKAFSTDVQLHADLLTYTGTRNEPLGVVLVSSNVTCLKCGGKLLVRSDRPSLVTLYTDDMGTILATQFRKFCQNYRKGCSFTQHYSYHSMSDDADTEVIYDANWADLPYFLSSTKTGFAVKFLERFDSELLLGQVSYNQKSDIYNHYNKYEKTSKQCRHPEGVQWRMDRPSDSEARDFDIYARAQLDRRRLEEAHLKYSVLQMYKRYPESFNVWKISPNVHLTLDEVTPIFYELFSQRYASHTCSYPGCGSVIVLDGNMKNRRNICAATEAGYAQFTNLPGSIKTGCQMTPLASSKYCYQHAPRASAGTFLREADLTQELCDQNASGVSASADGVIRFILGKKITRNHVYYQVAWLGAEEKISYEPAHLLPQSLIEEFEAGLMPADEVLTDSRYGVTSHTLITSMEAQQPSPKHAKTAFFEETGAFGGSEEKLTCNTEKDKSLPLHARTAGILVGMWPCGIVLMLHELFTAESKSQVYAALHELLTNQPKVFSALKYICYDDGCHLRKYAQNPKRSQLTPEAIKLSSVEIVIDKLHMAGHTDKWCLEKCNPRSFTDLSVVDTEVCEQYFSWLSKYAKITRRMNRNIFIFFLLNLCDLHNIREEHKLCRAKFM